MSNKCRSPRKLDFPSLKNTHWEVSDWVRKNQTTIQKEPGRGKRWERSSEKKRLHVCGGAHTPLLLEGLERLGKHPAKAETPMGAPSHGYSRENLFQGTGRSATPHFQGLTWRPFRQATPLSSSRAHLFDSLQFIRPALTFKTCFLKVHQAAQRDTVMLSTRAHQSKCNVETTLL